MRNIYTQTEQDLIKPKPHIKCLYTIQTGNRTIFQLLDPHGAIVGLTVAVAM